MRWPDPRIHKCVCTVGNLDDVSEFSWVKWACGLDTTGMGQVTQ